MGKYFGSFALAGALLAAPQLASAQSAVIYGGLGNFDIMNNTGKDAHGFEVELEGLQVNDVPYYFSVQRYGSPEVVATQTGVIVRWKSAYDAASGRFLQTTVAHAANAPFTQGMCYQWNPATYDAAGCEHFGVGALRNATNTTYRWLVEDAANAGALVPVTLNSPVPTPVYYIAPPVRPNTPPALVVEVPAPDPAESPSQYGDARWMKTFKTQLRREVQLDELLGDNPIVPETQAEIETEWELMQDTPQVEGKQKRKGSQKQGTLDADTRAVVRRFEIYEFTGAYDPFTHQAICADLLCNAPAADEVGDLIDAQMVAANVRVPSITASTVGGGRVTSSDKLISCGSNCTAFENAGAVVTLTATANSGSVFKRWGGACAGTQPACTLTVNEHADVSATFAQLLKVSISKSKTGTVTADQPGIDGSLSCGVDCTVTYAAGTVLTLTASPAPGKQFVNWSGGACNGSTTLTCTFVLSKDTSIQPIFTK